MIVLTSIFDGLREGFFMLWETLWALVLGFALSGAVQAFVSRRQMERLMGDLSPVSVGRATFFGMVSSSCSYAASAMAKSLFAKGADFSTAMIFMFASTNLVIELGIVLALLIGWQFTASEFLGGLVMIALFALVARWTLPQSLTEAARRRVQAASTHATTPHDSDGTESTDDVVPAAARMRTLAGWSEAASYTMADITMLRKEMLIGYGIAGFLAVLVPTTVWNTVFLSGHGFWTSLENVIVGPLIAVVSFVCSIGNVPLAAALWKGGISFGGVASFIFADLIAFPLILIYRKFYGRRLTLRMVGTFWLVMSLAGLITEYLFVAIHAVPSVRPTHIVDTTFAWNYTAVLNIIFLSVFAVLMWFSRNRERFGGGAAYAKDVVCGMQVERMSSPATASHEGTLYHFCSDRCHDHFVGNPERYLRGHVSALLPSDDLVTDPVCGMQVVAAMDSVHRTTSTQTYYFCCEACAIVFDRRAGIQPPEVQQ